MKNINLSDVVLWHGKYELTTRINDSKKEFHIALCIDQNYARCMGVTITSLVLNNSSLFMVFHIFVNSLSLGERQRLQEFAAKYNVEINIYSIDDKAFSLLKQSSRYPITIYFRLLVPKVLRGITDRFLYLDADIICIKEISELLEINLSDRIAAVVHDLEKSAALRIEDLELQSGKYFNSGVMLININRWLQENVTEKAIELLKENSKAYKFPDQDALNIVLDNKVVYIDRKWNLIFKQKLKSQMPSETRLIHYAGAKPWKKSCDSPLRFYFLKSSKLSLWADIPLDEPETEVEYRKYAKVLLKGGQLFSSIYWYGKYIRAKVSKAT